jgi:hypothetical protein
MTVFVCLGIPVLVLLLGFSIGHQQLLLIAARFWEVSDPLQPADAVAIFGGGIETRPRVAANYLRNGLVKKILVSRVSAHEPNHLLSHTGLNIAELHNLGIPDSAIEVFGCNSSNTYQEAMALRDWSMAIGIHSVIVPTEFFSARRVSWITGQVFRGTGVQVRVSAIGPADFLQKLELHDTDALLAFQRELVKYLGYRLFYWRVPYKARDSWSHVEPGREACSEKVALSAPPWLGGGSRQIQESLRRYHS